MLHTSKNRVAIIGAGVAGATCARLLSDAGFQVDVFEKSRGVGGRMSTRRTEWTEREGVIHTAHFDHGVPGFKASTPEFLGFMDRGSASGVLARWQPRIVLSGDQVKTEADWWVATPNMSAWCRHLLVDSKVTFSCHINSLRQTASGWMLESTEEMIRQTFDAVILAIPPLQAAALLQPHCTSWSDQAQTLSLLPNWVLMGVTNEIVPAFNWDIYRATSDPLALIIRNDTKPQRVQTAGFINWVVHANHDWSKVNLESRVEDVEAALKTAVADELGCPLDWYRSSVHRWRYASVSANTHSGSSNHHWWSRDLKLGVCGDAWSREGGVEGAWCSAYALAVELMNSGC